MTDEEKDLKQAQTVYNSLCETLDARNWHYEKDEEAMTINCCVRGNDIPIEVIAEVDEKRQLITMFSRIPFIIPQERRDALAVAVCEANNRIIDGCFDYNYLQGKIVFRMTASFLDSLIGNNLFDYLFFGVFYVVDEFNDKFLDIVKNEMSFEEIVKYINKEKNND